MPKTRKRTSKRILLHALTCAQVCSVAAVHACLLGDIHTHLPEVMAPTRAGHAYISHVQHPSEQPEKIHDEHTQAWLQQRRLLRCLLASFAAWDQNNRHIVCATSNEAMRPTLNFRASNAQLNLRWR